MTAVKPAWLSVELVPDLVSIIVPAHNRRELLRRALSSVVRQNYAPIECIVVDDGSTESIREVVEEAKSSSGSRVAFRYIRQNRAGGCAARNRGLKESRGEFIAFLGSGDKSPPHATQAEGRAVEVITYPLVFTSRAGTWMKAMPSREPSGRNGRWACRPPRRLVRVSRRGSCQEDEICHTLQFWFH
jgi:hypothetical protein